MFNNDQKLKSTKTAYKNMLAQKRAKLIRKEDTAEETVILNKIKLELAEFNIKPKLNGLGSVFWEKIGE